MYGYMQKESFELEVKHQRIDASSQYIYQQVAKENLKLSRLYRSRTHPVGVAHIKSLVFCLNLSFTPSTWQHCYHMGHAFDSRTNLKRKRSLICVNVAMLNLLRGCGAIYSKTYTTLISNKQTKNVYSDNLNRCDRFSL